MMKTAATCIFAALVGTCFAAYSGHEQVHDTDITESRNQSKNMEKMYMHVNGHTMTVTLADNSSAAALVTLLRQGPLTYSAHDYGNFEKVGDIGHVLPRNDEYIATVPGDVILYQGRNICIYYSENEWDFTRLGRIDGLSESELRSILGTGDCTVVLSLDGAASVKAAETDAAFGTDVAFGIDGKGQGKACAQDIYIRKGIKKIRK